MNVVLPVTIDVVLFPLAVYTLRISVSIFNILSIVHLPSDGRRILFLGKLIAISSLKISLNNNLNDFSFPLAKYKGKTVLIKNSLSTATSLGKR